MNQIQVTLALVVEGDHHSDELVDALTERLDGLALSPTVRIAPGTVEVDDWEVLEP